MNNPIIGIPVILMLFGLALWLIFVGIDANEPVEKRETKKTMLVNLLFCLFWPLSLMIFALGSFYEYWNSIDDE